MSASDLKETHLNEELTLQLVAAGDQDALMRLYRAYSKLVFSLALRIVGQSTVAEEVTQDVFVKLWQKPDRWNPAFGHFSGWLLTMTRNAAIDRLRREERHFVIQKDPVEEETTFPNINIEDVNWYNGQILRRLLHQLPEEQRQLIELAFYAGHTHSDLAERLQLPLGTVKTRLRLGLQKLRTLWVEATMENSLDEASRQ
ncbi:MAG: sigma-70 family RNA polymerase sigma factor [Caldilineaceae bacterium]